MELRDPQGRLYQVPTRRLSAYRLSAEAVAGLRARGGALGPDDLAEALPEGLDPGEPLRFLTGGGELYAVPERLLAGHERADPIQEILERGRRLIEEGRRLVDGEAELQPTDLRSLYPDELSRPEVARIHRYYAGQDPFTAFHRGRDAGRFAEASFTYGQTAVPALARALRRVEAGPGDRFLDLGCGCGAAVLTAATTCGFAVGVDLVPAAVDFCRGAARDLEIANVEFLVGDGRRVDLSEATVIYLAATAFDDGLCRDLEESLQGARPGTRIISVSRPFAGGRLEAEGQTSYLFSWTGFGEPCPVEFYFQRVATTTT